MNNDETAVLDSSGFSIDTVVTAWQGGSYDGIFAFSQVNTALSQVAIIVSVPKSPVYRRARPSRRAFVENRPSNARIFVILPVFL